MEPTANPLFKKRYSMKMQGNLDKEPQAFEKMYKNAGKVYFARLIGLFGDYVNDQFLESDQVDVIRPLIEHVQVRIHEKFVTRKRVGAWIFMEHLGTLSTHLSSVRHSADIPCRGGSNDPFFATSTMECFRYLFGEPNEVSYAVALLFAEEYLRFGGAIQSLMALRCMSSYPDLKWIIADDWAEKPRTGYKSYLMTVYLSHPGYPKLFSSPGVAETARANYEECIAVTKCGCACYLCQASRHRCVEVCLAPWPYHRFDSCDSPEASVVNMAKELTEVAVEHSPLCPFEITTKKPKKEFELWGAYWHNPELFDVFSLTANNSGLLFHRVQDYLLKGLNGINWEMAFPADFPKPLKEFVLREVEHSKIGKILQTTTDVVRLLEKHCNSWLGLEKGENATGDSDMKVALKNQLKAVALKVSAGMQSTKALMLLLSRACHLGDKEYKLGPYRFRGGNTDVRGIVRGMLMRGLPIEANGHLDSFSEWIWVLKLLYMTSKTQYQDKAVFLLEAVVGLTSVADLLEQNYLLCCKAMIARELVACGFDQRVISLAQLACGRFFVQHGRKIVGYLGEFKDECYVKTLAEKLTGRNPDRNLVSIENMPTALPETKQEKEEPSPLESVIDSR